MNARENTVTISFTTVQKTMDDGTIYATIPVIATPYLNFSDPLSYESNKIRHELKKIDGTARYLIQLYSGDYIPMDTREQGGLRNSSWKLTPISKGLVNVTGVYDLSVYKK